MSVTYHDLKNCRIARENPRSERSPEDIDTIAESILALGLLQNLVGYKKGDTVHITAGGTRLEAMRKLVKTKRFSDLFTEDTFKNVPIAICDKSVAIDGGLSSNLVQTFMKPADQFKAFSNLHHKQGVEIEDIAKRYFTDTAQVLRILKLASLAKPIFEAFAKDEISLDVAKAYAGCDNQSRQMSVFEEFGTSASAHRVRQSLRENTYSAKTRIVDFIGMSTYTERGGKLAEDLFEQDVILLDGDLVDTLFQERMKEVILGLRSDGWKEVTFCSTSDEYWTEYNRLGHAIRPSFEPTEEQQATIDAQSAILEEIEENHGMQWQWDDETREKANIAQSIINEIETDASFFSEEQRAIGHVLVDFNEHKGLGISYLQERAGQSASNKAPKVDKAYSDTFVTEVKRTSGQALMAHMALNPSRAIRIMTLLTLVNGLGGVSFIMKETREPKYSHDVPMSENDVYRTYNDMEPTERISYLNSLSDDELDIEMTRALMQYYDLGASYYSGDGIAQYRAIADIVGFNLSDAWIFDGEELSALSKKQLMTILSETMEQDTDAFAKAKKGEVVKVAERWTQQRKWTPDFVRTHPLVNASDSTSDTHEQDNSPVSDNISEVETG